MITFEIKSKSHVVFFVFLEDKEEKKEFTIEIFGAKKALFRTLHFFWKVCGVSSGVELGNKAINGKGPPLVC